MAVAAKVKQRSRNGEHKSLSLKAKMIGGAAGLSLAWIVISTSVAMQRGSEASDSAAADFAYSSPVAAITAAEQRIDAGDPAGAEVLAREALKSEPISSRALRVLILSALMQGHSDHAAKLLAQSAALGWRDIPTQLLLMQAYAQQGNYTQAAASLDAVMRVSGHDPRMFPQADAALMIPGFAKALALRLAKSPEWRSAYLQARAQNPKAEQAKADIVQRLAAMGGEIDPSDVDRIAGWMMQDDNPRDARRFWLAMHHARDMNVYDPDFADAGTQSPIFGWQLPHILGADVKIASEGMRPGLWITTDGTGTGVVVRQLLSLAPGMHQFHYQASINPHASRAFAWTVRCGQGGTPLLSGTAQAQVFVVPSQGCEGQRLELHLQTAPSAAGTRTRFWGVGIS